VDGVLFIVAMILGERPLPPTCSARFIVLRMSRRELRTRFAPGVSGRSCGHEAKLLDKRGGSSYPCPIESPRLSFEPHRSRKSFCGRAARATKGVFAKC